MPRVGYCRSSPRTPFAALACHFLSITGTCIRRTSSAVACLWLSTLCSHHISCSYDSYPYNLTLLTLRPRRGPVQHKRLKNSSRLWENIRNIEPPRTVSGMHCMRTLSLSSANTHTHTHTHTHTAYARGGGDTTRIVARIETRVESLRAGRVYTEIFPYKRRRTRRERREYK